MGERRDAMEPQELSRGDVVQLNPETVKNPAFAATFMIVTECKSFGAQGYVQALGTREGAGGLAFYRASWEEMEPIGVAAWVSGPEEESAS
jgi:hypothetical protein